MMTMIRDPKRWLAIGALVLLTPAFLVAHAEPKKGRDGEHDQSGQKRTQVADGGSAADYLLAVGATFLGAMFIRSRVRNPRPS